MLTLLRSNTETLAGRFTKGAAGVFVSWLLALLMLPLAAPAQAQDAAAESNYVLGANDIIRISVYGEEDLSFQEIRIGDSGRITYPFLGEVMAAGRSVNGLEAAIRRGLIDGEFLINPEVTVSIVEYRPFYIDGEVSSPGSYPFEPGLTLRRAISIAGGFTERASRSNIRVYSAEEGEGGNGRQTSSLDFRVQPGDVVVVAERFF